jgi:protease-4
MNENEKKFVQQNIDEIYLSFKQRVADGRKTSVEAVDSIAQGRVWSGNRAIGIGLVDKFGGLQDAVDCAARMARLSDYRLREYPETQNLLDRLFGTKDNTLRTEMVRKELGEDQFKIYNEMLRAKQMTNSVQARIPFEFFIN